MYITTASRLVSRLIATLRLYWRRYHTRVQQLPRLLYWSFSNALIIGGRPFKSLQTELVFTEDIMDGELILCTLIVAR